MSDEAHPKSATAVSGDASEDAPGDGGGRGETVFFDATLRPHRSLGPRGFLILMSAIAGTGFLIGFAFFLAGAWPVAGFCGLEILLVYCAFKLNYRDARRAEHLRLARPGGLSIAKVAPNGEAVVRRLEPGWLKVHIDEPPRHGSQLTLSSHGRTTVIGSFLTVEERAELAEALRRALARYRMPPAAGSNGPAVMDG